LNDLNIIGLLCSVWDDPRGVMRMLDQPTITDYDFVCFFDGKYKQWEGSPEFPKDEVANIIKDWANTKTDVNVYYEYVEDKTEAEKRNHMFFRAEQIGIDWAFIVDADEIPYIDKHEWNQEKVELADISFGCHSVVLDNYGMNQRRPRLYNMRERPYLLEQGIGAHSRIYSSIDGRDIASDITKTKRDVRSLKLVHDKSFYSEKKMIDRHEFGKTIH